MGKVMPLYRVTHSNGKCYLRIKRGDNKEIPEKSLLDQAIAAYEEIEKEKPKKKDFTITEHEEAI